MKKKVLEQRKKLISILWFIVKFNLLAIPLYILIYLNFSLPSVQIFLTNMLTKTLQLMGYQVSSEGFLLTLLSNNEIMRIEISMDCTGWKSMYLLAALIFVTPSKLKKKTKFLVFSLVFLFFVNFIRILTTILLSFRFGFQYLDIIHTFLWREGLIFVVIALWYLWLRRINYNIRKMKI